MQASPVTATAPVRLHTDLIGVERQLLDGTQWCSRIEIRVPLAAAL